MIIIVNPFANGLLMNSANVVAANTSQRASTIKYPTLYSLLTTRLIKPHPSLIEILDIR
jgi:hypothetical protein